MTYGIGNSLREYYAYHMKLDNVNYDLCAAELYLFARGYLERYEDHYIYFAIKVIEWFNRYWSVVDDLTSFYPVQHFHRRKDSFDFARSSAEFFQLLAEHDKLVGEQA